VVGTEHAAKARGRFVEDVVEIDAGAAVLFEREGGGEAGNSSADDGDPSQLCSSAAKAALIFCCA
jgi:hypothetical protein